MCECLCGRSNNLPHFLFSTAQPVEPLIFFGVFGRVGAVLKKGEKIMKIKKFSEKDIFLFKQFKGGSPEEKRKARDELVTKHKGLVYKISNQVYQKSRFLLEPVIDRDDLVQEGMLGLMQALKTYDYIKGVKFSTYAFYLIRSFIFRGFQKASLIRIPARLQKEFREINRITKSLRARLGREPSKKEIVKASGITLEDFEAIIQRIQISQNILSLETPIDSDGDAKVSLHGAISLGKETPEEDFAKKEILLGLQKKIRAIFRIGILNARERRYLERFFGLEGRDPENLSVIGRRESLSRERIRQIVGKAIDKLRSPEIIKIIRSEISLQEPELAFEKSEPRFLTILNLLQNTNGSYTEIGEILDTQKEKVERVARKEGIDGVSRMRRRRQERMEQNKERVLEGILNNPQMTYKEIGELLKLHKMTVTKIAWTKNIKRGSGKRSYPKKLTTRDKKILATAQQNPNLTHEEIGQLFNLSKSQVIRVLHRQGFCRSKALKVRNQKILNVIRKRPELSYRRIGKMFNFSHTTIKNIALQEGIARKAKTKK